MGPRKTTPLPPADSSGRSSNADSTTNGSADKTPTKTPSGRRWLSGTGSWRSKAPAVVRTATESIGISVSGGAASALPTTDDDKTPRGDSPAKFLTKRKSSKGAALPASTTHAHVSTDGLVQASEPRTPAPTAPAVDEPPLPPSPPKPAAASWGLPFAGWWSRPDGYAEAATTTEDAQRTPLPGPSPSEEPDASAKGLDAAPVDSTTCAADGSSSQLTGATTTTPADRSSDEPADKPSDAPADETSDTPADRPADKSAHKSTSSGSWFWLWSTVQNAQTASPSPQSPTGDFFTPNMDQSVPPPSAETPPAPTPTSAETAPQATATPPKPSGWAFWYTDKPSARDKPVDGEVQKHVGEVAVLDTPSQSHPEAAQFNEQEQIATNASTENIEQPPKKESLAKKSFASLRGRPKTKPTISETSKNTPASTKPTTSSKTSPTRDLAGTEPASAVSSVPPASPVPVSPTVKQATSTKQEPANLILPEFKNTYRFVQQKSFWKQIRQYFLGGESLMPHLHINPAPPRISKAVAIGVHGFFPAPIFQRIMGQPTGTSIRFANAAAAAIKEWSEAQGYTPEIEQVALEGEGFVAERVNTLWKLLLNWIEHIKAADFILVACHSQGVPVAIMLVAKLVQFGCISPTAKVGVCAMAGVNMGPFIEYKTKYFGPTAAELFEFSNPRSLVSQMYLAALDEVLRFGVKILYVGSIDDQLVSLESSTFSTISHPYIYRAVFVDGRIHAPDFLTHLVGFALKMRNLGLPDHGLIRELSPALAGSLYGGEGHSRVYEDPGVYSLAIQHTLETTSLPVQSQPRPSTGSSFQGINIPIVSDKLEVNTADAYQLRVKNYETPTTAATQNPYFLPWAMRGLLEEEFVKKELDSEVEELLGMFETWKPTAKQLKDVKFRLEGVRSKL